MLKEPITKHGNFFNYINRGTFQEVHISDIHFGVIDPKTQYDILEEQFINKILPLQIDILSINGDLFDHKFMGNSDVIMYAIKFVNRLVDICKSKSATLILIEGTDYHDASQLKLFYHYLEDSTIDIRIVETVKFEYVKGKKILCIPEMYAKPKEYYEQFLYNSGLYDSVYMHGTLKGTIFGKNEEELNSNREPVFSIDNFINCKGPIIAGHVHIPGCHNGHFYYCGTPLRYRFGEEEDKGFFILLHNLDTREYYIHFEEIKSFRYDTVNLDFMITQDPKDIISYIKDLQSQGIDNIRVQFTIDNEETLNIIKNYYKTSSTVKIESDNKKKEILQTSQDMVAKYKDYDYIFDNNLSEYDVLSRFINHNKGYTYITTEELKDYVNGIL